MKWNYSCTICGEWKQIDWDNRNTKQICQQTKKSYYPPCPAEQFHAYVDTHNWPAGMEETVIRLKGNKCTVINCRKDYETLDHRIAFSKGGKTSVENLFPKCNDCNQSKGDEYYQSWQLEKLYKEKLEKNTFKLK